MEIDIFSDYLKGLKKIFCGFRDWRRLGKKNPFDVGGFVLGGGGALWCEEDELVC